MKICKKCKKRFEPKYNHNRNLYCGLGCYWESLEGKHPQNMDGLKMGHGWNKGKKCPQLTGENNAEWKGNDVGYGGLHKWVRKHKGNPVECEHCGETNTRLEWASISRKCNRDLDDFMSLCVKCHRSYDNWREKVTLAIKRRKEGR